MTHRTSGPSGDLPKSLRLPLALTFLGVLAERGLRAFWPLASVLFVVLAALMLGLQDHLPVEAVWAFGAVAALAVGAALWRGIRRFRWPRRGLAEARIDDSLPGAPIRSLRDTPAVGAADPAAQALWAVHQSRMRARLARVRAIAPNLRISAEDPYALRFMAVLALSVAVIFGSVLRMNSVAGMAPGGSALASGPAWEGWMEPPAYTRLPAVYLNDITAGALQAPEGARFTLRLYGAVDALSLRESVSQTPPAEPSEIPDMAPEFTLSQSGEVAVEGPGGRLWQVSMIPDGAPVVRSEGEIETTYEGQSRIPFAAQDDYGVVAGTARFTLALDQVDRRYGRRLPPEPQPDLLRDLPMPIAGNRADFSEMLVEDYSQHPWANLPVRLELQVEDASGRTGLSVPRDLVLPGKRFFDPVAAALIEQRQALLWNRAAAPDVALILRALYHDPRDLFRHDLEAERLRRIFERLERLAPYGLSDDQQAALAASLWALALGMEEGDLADALDRLERAQERLEEAMRNGASADEIAKLMQELRDATDDYLRQLAQESERNGGPQQQQGDPRQRMEMSQNDLQEMMDRIQQLMEEGRMAEAMEALEQLRRMMENMEVTQGEGGQSQTPGEQAMEGLGETLRDQQELSDEAFRQLQEQFGQQPMGPRDPGQQGQQQGQQQPGQGQQGQQQGGGQMQDGQPGAPGAAPDLAESLSERQRALRDELARQRRNMPGQGTEAGEQAAEALGRAERAMENAEEALREGDLPGAINDQSEAMEALRDGMRSLGEALAEQQQGQGQQGVAEGSDPTEGRDPLGRQQGNGNRLGTEENLLNGTDPDDRARELVDEIRRRMQELDRDGGAQSQAELDYLNRLLDRF